ncbi:MAG TPA: MFS transporter [Edaphobacter sp.]|nr:MFS transporter [Edaphobacter sp.]
MLWLVCFFNYADRQAIFSVFPLLKAEFGLSDVQLGVVASCFMWMYALAGPAAGWVSDRISPRTVVLAALAFWSLVTAGTALAHSYSTLLVFRTLGGLGEAFYFPAAMSLIGMYHGPETRSRAMSLHQSSVYAGTIAGGAVSAYIAESHGWRMSFTVFGACGVLLALVLLVFLKEPAVRQFETIPNDSRAGLLHGVTDVLRNRRVLMMIGVFMGANFVAVIFLTWLPTFLSRKFHMSLANAGLSSTVYLQIASVVGVLLGGVLADRLASRRRGGRQLVQALGLLCGVPFLFLTGWSLSVRGLIAGMIGFGFFKGIYDANIWASLYDMVSVERRGVAAGVMNSIGWLGGGIAPIAVAAAAERFGLSATISASSAIYLLLAGAMFWIYRLLAAERPIAVS